MIELERMQALFDDLDDLYPSERKPSSLPRDLAAMIKLAQLIQLSEGENIISRAGYEEVILRVSPQALADAATEEDILLLRGLGLMYYAAEDYLYFMA